VIALVFIVALAAAPCPSGWWIVDASSGRDVGKPGAAWSFGDEVVTVDAQRQAARRTRFDCKSVGVRAWRCQRTANGELNTLELSVRADGELVATLGKPGEPPYGQLDARPARPEEAKALDAVSKAGQVEDAAACGAAKRCYDLACPEFGDPHDPCIFEKHSMSHDASTCRQLVPLLVNTLQALDRPIPPECSPHPNPLP
jgi:hypothetical protein